MFFVVACGVAGQFQNFGAKILEHGGKVDGRDCRDAALGDALAEIALKAADGELHSCASRSRYGLLAAFASTSGHSTFPRKSMIGTVRG